MTNEGGNAAPHGELVGVTPAQEPQVYVWPVYGEEPIVTAQSVAINTALAVTVERFASEGDDVRELNILSPEAGSRAESAHWLLLLLLENSSIEFKVIAAELGYKSTREVKRKLGTAAASVEADSSLANQLDIMQIKYKRRLGMLALEPATDPVPAPQPVPEPAPPSEPEPMPDPAADTRRPPALSEEDQELFKLFRAEDSEAAALLEKRYEQHIYELIDDCGSDAPAEIVDIAWEVFDHHAKSADLSSPHDFGDTLRAEVENRLVKVMELHKVAQLTRNLDVRHYRRQIKDFEADLGSRRVKPSLDSATIEAVTSIAEQYLHSRLDGETDHPIKGYFRVSPYKRPQLAENIRAVYKKTLTRLLKVSAYMSEQGAKDFHLAQLPEEKLVAFLALHLDDVARSEIERFRQHQIAE